MTSTKSRPLGALEQPDMNTTTSVDLWRRVMLIRRFEERLLSLFSEGKVNGTVHTCVGQEWTGVAIAESLRPKDVVFSNHRGHGHYLARYENPVGLFAEVMGRSAGVSGGIGGTQHLVGDAFYSNGIQGGMVPVAVGAGLAFKLRGESNITVNFVGDGTLGEGALYESLNIASLWQVPLLLVLEHNGYAQSTQSTQTTAGSVAKRAAAFDIKYFEGSTWEWGDLLEISREAVDYVRAGKPAVLQISTYRLNAHSKGDDNRDPAEVRGYYERDPLSQLQRSNPALFASLDAEVTAQIDAAVAEAWSSPVCAYRPTSPHRREAVTWRTQEMEEGRHADLIHRALREAFDSDSSVVMIGEDIEGPYGGAFKVAKDLSQVHTGRVRNAPISEAAITGISTGMALNGMIAVAEIMFGDFLTLTFDQIYQHAAKFATMYNGRCQVPVIVRTPMGGKRGYGPTHSQSIEKFFLGVPGLTVLALNNRWSPLETYRTLLSSITSPTLVIENKILYTRFLDVAEPSGFAVAFSDEKYPTVRISPESAGADVTVVCYGGNLEDVERAASTLFDEDEILCEIICPTQLFPLNVEPIIESVAKTGRVLIVEEGPTVAGFGSEVLGRLSELGAAPRRAMRMGYDGLIPASAELELALLPSANGIVKSIRELVNG